METVHLNSFFSHSHEIRQTVKTQGSGKGNVWGWYITDKQDEHVHLWYCLEKLPSIKFIFHFKLMTFYINLSKKKLISSESKSMANCVFVVFGKIIECTSKLEKLE